MEILHTDKAPAAIGPYSQAIETGGLNHVVKTTCYLKSMEDFSLFNEIYAQYFKDHKPARSCFAVAQLPKDALVEIEVIAAR